MNWEFGVSRYQLVYTGWINKVLLYSTEHYIQYPITIMEKNMKKNIYTHTHTHSQQNHFAVQQKLTQHYKSSTVQ